MLGSWDIRTESSGPSFLLDDGMKAHSSYLKTISENSKVKVKSMHCCSPHRDMLSQHNNTLYTLLKILCQTNVLAGALVFLPAMHQLWKIEASSWGILRLRTGQYWNKNYRLKNLYLSGMRQHPWWWLFVGLSLKFQYPRAWNLPKYCLFRMSKWLVMF